jgi:hypothetical protein
MWVKPENQHQKVGITLMFKCIIIKIKFAIWTLAIYILTMKLKKQNKIEHDKCSNMEDIRLMNQVKYH